MAAFNRTCLPGPMFMTNFSPNNLNMNMRPERPPIPPFQGVPNPPFRPFQQAPQRFAPRTFSERPRFSQFSNQFSFQGFRNRSPAPEKSSPLFVRHPTPRPRFGNRFERPFRPWNPRPPFMAPRQPFQNRPRAPVHPYPHRDFTSQADGRKQKTKVARKLKDDSTEKPFSCDTCDKAFLTIAELNYHFSEHVKCDSVNCMFEAHPKVVALHKKMQHETGYADVINKLQDDAEIQKWREERRNRFPTAENIRKRRAEQAEREARGEILETKEFGKFKRQRGDDWRLTYNRGRRRRGRWNNRYDRRHSNFQNRQLNNPFIHHANSESDSDNDSHISLTMFSGLSSLTYSARSLPRENEYNLDSHREQQELPKEDGKEVSTCNSDKNESTEFFSDSIIYNTEFCTDFDVPSNNISSDKTTVVVTNENVKDEIREIASDLVLKTENEPDNINDELNVSPDDSVLEASITESEKCPEVIDIADSDDEGPAVLPITKRKNGDSDDEPVIISRYSSVEELSTNGVAESASISFEKKDDKNAPLNDISNITGSVNNEKSSNDPPLNGDSNVSSSKDDGQSTNGNRYNRYQKNQQFQENPFERKDKAFVAKKSTLLEKLLADDIRHERNVILQCVRHIVNNKFFGVGNEK